MRRKIERLRLSTLLVEKSVINLYIEFVFFIKNYFTPTKRYYEIVWYLIYTFSWFARWILTISSSLPTSNINSLNHLHVKVWAKMLVDKNLSKHYNLETVPIFYHSFASNLVKRLICQPNTCQNGGTCTEDGSIIHCNCQEDFKGKLCEG